MSQRSEMGKLIRKARKAGCHVEQAKRGGHWKITTPDGQLIVAPFSPGTHRGVRDTIARLKAAGITI